MMESLVLFLIKLVVGSVGVVSLGAAAVFFIESVNTPGFYEKLSPAALGGLLSILMIACVSYVGGAW